MKRISTSAVRLFAAGLVVGAATIGANADDTQNEELFSKLDTNSDGVLVADEIPEEQRRFFGRILRVGDANEDEKISKAEFLAAVAEREEESDRGPEGRGRGFGGGRPDPSQFLSRMDRNEDGQISREELPEFARERMGRIFDEAGKDSLSLEEFGKAMAAMGRGPGGGPGRPGAGPEGGPGGPGRGPGFLAQFDKNEDGKVSKDELPEEARERMAPLFERLGSDEIDLERFAEMAQNRGRDQLAQRPDGERPPRDGDRPPREGDRPRDGERPPREGDRPRDGERPPREGDRPEMRDGEGRPPFGGRGRGPAFIRVLDEDGNGRISKAEMIHIAKLFAELDNNNDGELDGPELMGFGGPPEGRPGEGRPGEGRPGEAGRPGEGGRGGFGGGPGGAGGPGGRGGFFARMDSDGDGFLSKEEAQGPLQEAFDSYDTSKDGKLSEEELREGFMRRFGDRGRPGGGRPEGDRPDGERREGGDRPERPRRPDSE
ncbi:MAG: hypothetical protein KDA80_23310 [Planctomycetaceae bacterium]|nr:hypothetical protein [Planctomycetaceae bacterium]